MTLEENLKFKEDVIKEQFKKRLGYELNLDNPKTFNEKIQWLKLYYNDPLMTKCADKYLVREFIKDIIGEEYLIPLIGVWDRPEDIDFNMLPNQFVLKVNWGSGQNIIVKDKSILNIKDTINQLKEWMKIQNNNYYSSFEWQYKNIKPKIICEKYIEQLDGQLYDYKVFCFNGVPKYIQVNVDLVFNNKGVIYDCNWIKQDFLAGSTAYKKYNGDIIKPHCFDNMLALATVISSYFINVRVDFYIINNNIFLGELTFTHQNGMGKFEPIEWDYKFGELLELPKNKNIEYSKDYFYESILQEQSYNLDILVTDYKKLLIENKNLNTRFSRLEMEKDSILLDLEKEKNDINNWKHIFSFYNSEDKFIIYIFGIRFLMKKKQSRAEQSRAEQSRAEQSRAEQSRAEQSSRIL